MVEGELKKRLWDWMTNEACSKEEPKFLDLARFQAEESLQKIVDEAKKDLEENSEIQELELVGETDVLRLKVICIDYDNWKKWFGDSS